MIKKRFVFLSFLTLLAAALTSCLFESDDNALSSWLADQGLPDSYKVQTLVVDDISVLNAETFLDTAPKSANEREIFGHVSNLTHDLVLDFAFDTTLLSSLGKADSAASILFLRLLTSFYNSKPFPKDSFPLTEELPLTVSWKMTRGDDKKFIRQIGSIKDSVWYESLKEWDSDASVDTTLNIKIKQKDSILALRLPTALVDSVRSEVRYTRLQLRLSAPKAARAYRFMGPNTGYGPEIRFTTLSDTTYKYRTISAFRAAGVISSGEDCSDCQILHGGTLDSVVVEVSSSEIMKAMKEFYGDDFPYNVGNGFDVRQAVVLAQLTFPRDDSQGSNELGLPLQVVVGSYVDSADTQVRKMESYKLDKEGILVDGHPNMVFHEGDSLSLQLTYGFRDFINKASDGRTFKFIMRLGYPVLQEKDSTYANYVKAKGDTSYVFFSHFDYARYDFSQSLKSPARLKLWLASKRGDE